MHRAVASRTVALVLALLAIGTCGNEASPSVHTAPATTASVTSQDAPPPSTEIPTPATAPRPTPIVISDQLALERLPDSFQPLVAAEQTNGRFGERMAWQRFVSYTRRGSVVVSIAQGRPATDLLAEPGYAASTLAAPGVTLFEYQNRTTLTSSALAWAIAPDVVITVTSRELSNIELLEWIPLIAARP